VRKVSTTKLKRERKLWCTFPCNDKRFEVKTSQTCSPGDVYSVLFVREPNLGEVVKRNTQLKRGALNIEKLRTVKLLGILRVPRWKNMWVNGLQREGGKLLLNTYGFESLKKASARARRNSAGRTASRKDDQDRHLSLGSMN